MAEPTHFTDREGQQWIALAADAYIDGNAGQRILDLSLRILEKGIPRVAVDLSPTRVVNSVGIALIEACINAFEHSRSKDEQISINFAIGDEDLTIQISDTGQGFEPESAKKEVVERRERGESNRGWGLTIMSELMDHVNIQSDENGTVITMIKRR